MNKKTIQYPIVLLSLTTVVAFQNCSKSGFKSATIEGAALSSQIATSPGTNLITSSTDDSSSDSEKILGLYAFEEIEQVVYEPPSGMLEAPIPKLSVWLNQESSSPASVNVIMNMNSTQAYVCSGYSTLTNTQVANIKTVLSQVSLSVEPAKDGGIYSDCGSSKVTFILKNTTEHSYYIHNDYCTPAGALTIHDTADQQLYELAKGLIAGVTCE